MSKITAVDGNGAMDKDELIQYLRYQMDVMKQEYEKEIAFLKTKNQVLKELIFEFNVNRPTSNTTPGTMTQNTSTEISSLEIPNPDIPSTNHTILHQNTIGALKSMSAASAVRTTPTMHMSPIDMSTDDEDFFEDQVYHTVAMVEDQYAPIHPIGDIVKQVSNNLEPLNLNEEVPSPLQQGIEPFSQNQFTIVDDALDPPSKKIKTDDNNKEETIPVTIAAQPPFASEPVPIYHPPPNPQTMYNLNNLNPVSVETPPKRRKGRPRKQPTSPVPINVPMARSSRKTRGKRQMFTIYDSSSFKAGSSALTPSMHIHSHQHSNGSFTTTSSAGLSPAGNANTDARSNQYLFFVSQTPTSSNSSNQVSNHEK